MKRPILQAALVLLAALAMAPAPARADQSGQGVFERLNYGIASGVMEGVGPQGATLRRGPYLSFNVHGESAIGMQLGVEAAYASSEDYFKTQFFTLGGIARLSPTPEDYRVFVQLGASVSHVTYGSPSPGATRPENKTRPGGSFGVGLDLIQKDHYSIGGLISYNGVVLARSAARSYLVAAINVTFKPSAY
jgi:hypothetical protein